MPRVRSRLCVAAAISIAATAVPASVTADPSGCEKGQTGPVGTDASTAGGVNIHLTAGNTVIWCPASVIEANSDVPPDTNYPERATSRSPNDNPVSNAISINKLLTLAGLNPTAVGFTHVVRSTGTWATLDRSDVSATPSFQDGLKPIVWINGGETDYLRPLRSSTDTNAQDFVTAQGGAAIDLFVSSGQLLQVFATGSPQRVQRNQPVSFAAAVANATPADGKLTFSWDFADGSVAKHHAVQHSFSSNGTYYVVVTVRGRANDSGGASEPVPITVGKPPTGGNGGTPGGSSKNGSNSGPTHSNGNTTGGKPNHKNKPSSGGSAPSTATTPTTPSTTPTTPVTPAPAPVTPAPAPVTPIPTVPQITTPRLPAHPRLPHVPRAHKPIGLPSTATGTIVRGLLISSVTPISPQQLAAQTPAGSQGSAPSARLAGGSVTPVAGLLAGAAVLLLLASGAGLELREQRRPVTPAPRS